MRDFVAQRHNLLLCSTIIETGIDVPSANTIVISRADKFGLAQLHQLRGRVGRSHHQAYAYLLVPDVESLTKQAAQRLQAIQDMEELGSGFYLAMHDLEIRGAGEVLGENQSGNMMEVGFQLYNDMLAEAVRSLKAGREPDLMSPAERGHRDQPARAGAAARRLLRRRAHAPEPLQALGHGREARADRPGLLEEITDRFGKLPTQGQTLFDTHRLRVLAQTLRRAEDRRQPEADERDLPRQTRRSTRSASSSSCRRTEPSSSPATTSCASSARSASRPTARISCVTC